MTLSWWEEPHGCDGDDECPDHCRCPRPCESCGTTRCEVCCGVDDDEKIELDAGERRHAVCFIESWENGDYERRDLRPWSASIERLALIHEARAANYRRLNASPGLAGTEDWIADRLIAIYDAILEAARVALAAE